MPFLGGDRLTPVSAQVLPRAEMKDGHACYTPNDADTT